MRILLLIISLLFLGCQEVVRPEQPENLIPKDLMIEILADAYIGNAARSVNNRMLRTEGIRLDSILYKKYDIDSLQFAASNAFYTSDLNLYTEIITEVEVLLNKRKAELDTLIQREKEKNKQKTKPKEKDTAEVESGLIEPVQDLEE